VPADDALQPLRHIVRGTLPRDRDEGAVCVAHPRFEQALRVIVLFGQRAALDAAETLRHGVLAVAPDLHHPALVEFDLDPTEGVTEAAEGFGDRHRGSPAGCELAAQHTTRHPQAFSASCSRVSFSPLLSRLSFSSLFFDNSMRELCITTTGLDASPEWGAGLGFGALSHRNRI